MSANAGDGINMAAQSGRPLYFAAVVSSSFFLSPILNSRRLDVYHTSTDDVALVQIYNACLKCATRGSLKYRRQKLRKNRHLRTIVQLCRVISLQLGPKARIDNRNC